MRHLIPSFLLGLLALSLCACGGGGAGGGGAGDPEVQQPSAPLEEPPVGDPNDSPRILTTAPAHGSAGNGKDGVILVVFDAALDPASVNNQSMRVQSPRGIVSGTVRLDNAVRLVFDPSAPLPYGAVYLVTVKAGLRDLQGNERSGDYTFAFRVEEADPTSEQYHEFEVDSHRSHGVVMQAGGDGMSLMLDQGSVTPLRFRRIRNGVPTGPIESVSSKRAYLIPASTFDISPQGHVQYAWTGIESGRRAAFAAIYDRYTDAWQPTVTLTPDVGVEAVSVEAEMSDSGGLVAWIENDVGDSGEDRVYAARHDRLTALGAAIPLTTLGGEKGALQMSRKGSHGVVAFRAVVGGHSATHASRFAQVGGFSSAALLDTSNLESTPLRVAASPTGHLYVLYRLQDPNDAQRGRLHLAVAQPGGAFGTGIPLHTEYTQVRGIDMDVGDNGILTLAYGITGSEQGVWARRYTPGTGLSNAVDITAVGATAQSSGGNEALDVAANESGDAVVAVSIRRPQAAQAILAALLPVGRPWTLGLELAAEVQTPTTRSVRIAVEPSTGALVSWISRLDEPGEVHYGAHARRILEDGSLGNTATFNVNRISATTGMHLSVDRAGRGVLLYTAIQGSSAPSDDVMQVLFR